MKSTATLTTRTGRQSHDVVSPADWLAARTELLVEEKKFMRLHDQLKKWRRALPWTKVEKEYRFEGPDGPESLADLFAGQRQLIVYHFMFPPDDDAGCPHCSFWADHFDGAALHLGQRDTAFAAISRAPWRKLARFRRRMGWKFNWVSSGRNEFNYDFHVSFTPEALRTGQARYNYAPLGIDLEDLPGVSTFYRDKRAIYHTYSTFSRGIDLINTTYNFLDLTAKGRDEDPEQAQDWVRYHDKYRKR